jgi:hypothetical protein
MTRRKFFEYTAKTIAAIAIGSWFMAKRAAVRVFVRAEKTKKYPGRIKPLSNIHTQGRWSG